MVPLMAFLETFNYSIEYLSYNRLLVTDSNNEEKKLSITIGSSSVSLNGRDLIMQQSALIQNGQTYVPLRNFAEFFGLNVDWYKNKSGDCFIWVSESALLNEIDFTPDGNYELINHNSNSGEFYAYELKKEGQTYRGAKINDSHEKIIELYGKPDKISYSGDSTLRDISYSYMVEPEFGASRCLMFYFSNGKVDKVILYYEP
jgi:hypothetical protein